MHWCCTTRYMLPAIDMAWLTKSTACLQVPPCDPVRQRPHHFLDVGNAGVVQVEACRGNANQEATGHQDNRYGQRVELLGQCRGTPCTPAHDMALRAMPCMTATLKPGPAANASILHHSTDMPCCRWYTRARLHPSSTQRPYVPCAAQTNTPKAARNLDIGRTACRQKAHQRGRTGLSRLSARRLPGQCRA